MASSVSRCSAIADCSNLDWSSIIKRNTTPQEFDEQRGKMPGYELDIGGFQYTTALSVAAIRGNVSLIEHIVQMGGKDLLKIGNFSGDTPLFYAIQFDQYEAAKKLIELGSNVNIARRFGSDGYFFPFIPEGATPLWMALKTHHMIMVKLLLCNGAVAEPKLRQEDVQVLQQAIREIGTKKPSLISTVYEGTASIAMPLVLVEMIANYVPLEEMNTEKEIRECLVAEALYMQSTEEIFESEDIHEKLTEPAAIPSLFAKLIAEYASDEVEELLREAPQEESLPALQ